jgi:hypothetical protein
VNSAGYFGTRPFSFSLDVELEAAGHHDIAGLLIGFAGPQPLRLDRRRRVARHRGRTVLGVHRGFDGVGGIEIASDFGMRGNRRACYTAYGIRDVAGRGFLDIVL